MKNSLQKAIKEMQEYEIINEENNSFSSFIPIQDAIDILERFEIELINELTCEQLNKLQRGFKELS